ncbi:MAG: response regulator [Dehalococcoidia bacterium]
MPRTILIVEDDSDAREIYAAALAAHGYRVVTAVHGAEGVHLARKNRPDLILMDLKMPIMDGLNALRYIKSDPAISHIPVWAISAYLSDDEGPEELGRMRFDRLLAKPMDPNAMVDQVASFLPA